MSTQTNHGAMYCKIMNNAPSKLLHFSTCVDGYLKLL